MFKRLLILSGLISLMLTAFVYWRFMVPTVDVQDLPAMQSMKLTAEVSAADDAVIAVEGIIDRTGTTLLGKREVLLTDSAASVAVMCTFVFGEPGIDVKPGQRIAVKGVWRAIPPNTLQTVPVVLGQLTDCVLTD